MSKAQLLLIFPAPSAPDPFAQLEQHFRDAHRSLKPRTPIPPIHAEFFPFAGLNHTARMHDGRIRVRVSDIFRNAPADVIGSLALILLAKLYRKGVDNSFHGVYRRYILQSDVQEQARIARVKRGRTPRQTKACGRHIDLKSTFDRLNQEYFNGAINRPKLSWSQKRSRYILGRYDALHHTIFISLVFDSTAAPGFVVDYIMFHEMLHIKHRSRVEDNRCIVHSAEFKADERKFAQYQPARQWLKTL